MFGRAEDRKFLVEHAYKRYFDKHFGATKRFNDSDVLFFDWPKKEPKTAKEREEQISKSKLVQKSTGPFSFICHSFPTSLLSDNMAQNFRSPSTAAQKIQPKIQLRRPKSWFRDDQPRFPTSHHIVNER